MNTLLSTLNKNKDNHSMSKKIEVIGIEVGRNVNTEGGSATGYYSYLVSFMKLPHAIGT